LVTLIVQMPRPIGINKATIGVVHKVLGWSEVNLGTQSTRIISGNRHAKNHAQSNIDISLVGPASLSGCRNDERK